MSHLLQCAVRQAVAADAQLRQLLVQFGQKDSQAAVFGSYLRQVEHRFAPRLLHQLCTWNVVLCQGEQRRQVCREEDRGRLCGKCPLVWGGFPHVLQRTVD